ncbi:MAG: esterase [Acidobacteria bacterium]|nr:MAG: esterase [Acidobacteriota bacterium]
MTSALVLIVLAATAALAQPPAPPPPSPPPAVISPEVHPDRRVTFRLRAPNAREVVVERQGVKLAMEKDEQGLWTVTTGPLEPDIYGYSFVVDGVTHFDPSNPATVPNYLYTASSLHVPGPSLPWEAGAVPRGEVHHHFHHSAVVGDDRDFYVYTPPGYDPEGKKRYPVLYLLHGFSDDARAWTEVGRAHVILDNLIASGKARPMLVVMPFGYGAPEILSRTGPQFRDVALRQRNQQKFRETLLQDVIPTVEKLYHVSAGRESRAVAGLSMGGGESLDVGLNARDHFAWVGAFSSAVPDDPDAAFPGLNANTRPPLRLLWIACGTEDFLTAANRKFWDWLQARQVPFTKIETPGGHTWPVWRRNLAALAPLLFR